MRRLLLAILVVLCFWTVTAAQYVKVLGQAEHSSKVVVSGTSSTNSASITYPASTIDIYNTGTTTHTPIFSTATGTVKANPFTADSFAIYDFFVAPGTQFDVRISGVSNGVTITPFTRAGYTAPNGVAGSTVMACAGSNDTALLTAANSTSGTIIIPNGVTCASNTQTLTVTIRIDKGGLLEPLNAQTLTLTGYPDAGVYRTFTNATAGQGTILFHAAPVTGDGQTNTSQVYPQWWGAVADRVTDCAPAIQSAVNSGAREVFFPGGAYVFWSPVTQTANNVNWQGQTRGPYTDFLPHATDIHVGGGKNAMLINGISDSTPFGAIKNIRFTSDVAFNGYAINTEDHAMFSAVLQDVFVSMGQSSLGFFKGQMSDCFVVNLDIENNRVGFNAQGTFAGNTFNNIHALSCNDAVFYTVDTVSSNRLNTVNNLFITAQVANIGLVISNASEWVLNNVNFDSDSGGIVQAAFASFDNCTKLVLSNFTVKRQSGNLGGILLNNTQGKISHGFINDVRGITGIAQAITVTGTADIDLNDLTIESGTVSHLGITSSGNVRLSHSRLTGSAAAAVVSTMPATANITIRNNELLNANSGVGAILDVNTSGRFLCLDNTIGVDDGVSTPTGDFKLTNLTTGTAVIENNQYVGGINFTTGAGSTQPIFTSTLFVSAMPTTSAWKAGSKVFTTAPAEAGAGGSKYIIIGWVRVTTGGTNVLNTDWFQMRTLTGN